MWIWRPEQETLLWTQLGTLIGATAALLDYSDPRTLLIIKYASLAALTVQEVSSTALLRLSQTSHEESEKYFISAGVAVMQLFKTVVSLFLLRFLDSKGYSSTSEALSDVWQVTKSDLVGTMNVIFVCSAYVAQNFMYFAAAHYVDTTVFLVISQMKTLTAAVFAVLLANRVISLVQWVSLVMLMAGVCMVQTSMVKQEKKELSGHAWIGFVSLLGAAVISGLAGTIFELLVKRDSERGLSLWVRAFQLNALSIVPAAFFALAQDGAQLWEKGFLYGFNGLVWATVIAQGAGGLLVALVLRYADNVVKSFATAMAIIASIFLDTLFLGVHLPPKAMLGAVMVVLAIFGYTS